MSFSLFSLTIYFIIAAIGFMMGYLFKHAKTNAQTFSPNPKIVLKIYMLSFVVALVTTYALSYFATHSLVTSASPEEGDINYHNERSLMIFALNFFFFILNNEYRYLIFRLFFSFSFKEKNTNLRNMSSQDKFITRSYFCSCSNSSGCCFLKQER